MCYYLPCHYATDGLVWAGYKGEKLDMAAVNKEQG